ncbi:hypothetical protein BC827DRAFT_1249376 [Russula dissimulans]|nr:hypothetical protein BC827DRAFT_1249376 [Russula dissimulans]
MIEDSETVFGLKEAIAMEIPNDLQGVDPYPLELYKIDIPDGKNLKQRAKDAPKEELDVSTRKLSDIFPSQPLEERVSILVKVPGIITSAATVAHIAQSVPQTEMFPTIANATEFTMKLRGFECWDSLCEADLSHSDISEAESQLLQEFQERLGRKRYITGGVRAVLRCCRPPDFRCSRHRRYSGKWSSPVRRSLQGLWIHFSSKSHQRKPIYRNWTE